MTKREFIPIQSPGKGIQDKPSKRELVQEYAFVRGWQHVRGYNVIYDESGDVRIADSLDDLTRTIERCDKGFIHTDSGMWQLGQAILSRSDEEVSNLQRPLKP